MNGCKRGTESLLRNILKLDEVRYVHNLLKPSPSFETSSKGLAELRDLIRWEMGV
jgi:hypothetical protein